MKYRRRCPVSLIKTKGAAKCSEEDDVLFLGKKQRNLQCTEEDDVCFIGKKQKELQSEGKRKISCLVGKK